ncbi:hypothetical protein MON38_21180 [Hymenobacter sp. DH14]|uniref:Uncharacterized protein n=1 Tax=Hymenobacter cyanobacteriorum TaxID=2926463 RepID=A0A9X1VJQ8_9BACT|nr:hypothetical protein [Hymenobacter cyanobacteriorum]MCI1189945.1 hypothetical protein [Hymenobacter cyanobacteriorum]
MTSRTVQAVPMLDLRSKQANKERVLVEMLLRAPEATQLQLAKAVYGKATPAKVQALQKLQSRVQGKLLNQLYFLDHSDQRHLVSRRYELECLDLVHKVSILYAERDFKLAERLLLRCLRLAETGEFTQYVVQTARMLRNLYGEQRKPAPYKKVTKTLLKAQQQLAWEDEAEQLQADMQLAVTSTVAARRNLLAAMPGHLAQLEGLYKRGRSFGTYNALYRARITYEELRGNFKELIRVVAAAERHLQEGKLNPRRFDLRFNHFMTIYAYLRSRQPVRGLLLAERYIRDFHPSSNNWFYFQEHHVLLAMHAGRYELAQQVLDAVAKNPAIVGQREAAMQRWDLYRSYLNFVLPTARVLSARQRQVAQQMLLLPEYSRDKRGHNVAILVLQLLHYLRERNLELVLLRLERLRKYQQRHLTEATTLRSRLFLRLLQVIVDKNFEPKKAAERGQKLLQHLRDTPPPGEAFAEVEIIPYENLWEIVLGLLREGPPVAAE